MILLDLKTINNYVNELCVCVCVSVCVYKLVLVYMYVQLMCT